MAAKGFTTADLNEDFFAKIAASAGIMSLDSHTEVPFSMGTAFTTEMQKRSDAVTKISGFKKFKLTGKTQDGGERSTCVLIKSKPNNFDNYSGWVNAFKEHGEEAHQVAALYWGSGMSMETASEMEVRVAELAMNDPFVDKFRPHVLHTILDKEEEKFVVVMDFIDPDDVIVGGGINPSEWIDEYIHVILSELAKFHSHYLGDLGDLEGTFQKEFKAHPRRHLNAIPFWKEFAKVARKKYQQQFTESRFSLIGNYMRDLGRITVETESFPMTLVHNDLMTGNLWLRRNPTADQSALCMYDYEFACVHVPQRDVISFLKSCTLPKANSFEQFTSWRRYAEHYRVELIKALQQKGSQESVLKKVQDKDAFYRILDYQVFEGICNRSFIEGIIPDDLQHGYDDRALVDIAFLYVEEAAKKLGLL